MASVENGVSLPSDGVIMKNLRGAMYKMAVQPIEGRITSMAANNDHVFVAVANQGCFVFKVLSNSTFSLISHLHAPGSKQQPGCSVYNLQVGTEHLVYIKDVCGESYLCVHNLTAVLCGEANDEELTSLQLTRKGPMVLVDNIKLIAIGGVAWTKSWTAGESQAEGENTNGCNLHILHLEDMTEVKRWQVVDNGIAMIRSYISGSTALVGIADIRTGLKVYDLNQPTDASYHCLYQVPIEEIRNFTLIGDAFIGVFHKFEPNVSFWNMQEQKTILCINIQDQLRELAEEFEENDDDEDLGMYGDDDDYVTSVTTVPTTAPDSDHVLMYATKSGCVFGMSVNNRTKLFNIPCPHASDSAAPSPRRDISALCFLADGKMVVAYDRHGLTLLDFSPENPPDRPPTRHQKRS